MSGSNKKTIFLCNFTCLIMENVLLCAFHRKMANCEKPHSWNWRNYLPWISICLTVSRIGSTSSYGRLRSWLLLSFSHSKLKKGFFGLFWTTIYSRLVPCEVLKCRCWNVGNSEGKYCNCIKPQKYFTKQKTTKHFKSSINNISRLKKYFQRHYRKIKKKHWLF